jgi:hypothetical protein
MAGSIFDSKGRELLAVPIPKAGLNETEKAATVLAVTLIDADGNPVEMNFDANQTVIVGLMLDQMGFLNLPKDPEQPQHAATKRYVDASALAAAILAAAQPHPIRMSSRTVGSSTGLTLNDGIIFVTAECSLTLPSAVVAGDGFLYIVKNRTEAADVSLSSVEGLIENAPVLTLKARNSVILASDGHDWYVL